MKWLELLVYCPNNKNMFRLCDTQLNTKQDPRIGKGCVGDFLS